VANLAPVITPSPTSAAITVPSAIFAEVIEPSAIFDVDTDPSAGTTTLVGSADMITYISEADGGAAVNVN